MRIMKRNIIAAAFIMTALFASVFGTDCNAQDSSALVDMIEKSNEGSKGISGSFTEIRQKPGKADKNLTGDLIFDPAGSLSMKYASPNQGEYFIIENGTLSMKRDGAENKFDLAKNRPMKNLSDMLLSSLGGKLKAFSQANACNLTAEKTSDAVRATLEATKKAVKGYSKIVLDYNPKTLRLVKMRAEEFDGTVTTYIMQ